MPCFVSPETYVIIANRMIVNAFGCKKNFGALRLKLYFKDAIIKIVSTIFRFYITENPVRVL